MDAIRPTLLRVVRPVADAWAEPSAYGVLERAEVDVGFGIEASGNFFLASGKGNVDLKINLVVARKEVTE